jgi:hypothetical protein
VPRSVSTFITIGSMMQQNSYFYIAIQVFLKRDVAIGISSFSLYINFPKIENLGVLTLCNACSLSQARFLPRH